jgi:calcium uniporter protein, mitochondrial
MSSMWRVSRRLLRAAASASTSAIGRGAEPRRWVPPPFALQRCGHASLPDAARRDGEEEVTAAEARRLMRLTNVDALKRRLGDGEVIPYADLLRACQDSGAARTRAEAAALAGALDEAGVVLLFRDRVYLQPDKVSSHCRCRPLLPPHLKTLSLPDPPVESPRSTLGFSGR